MSHGAGSPVRRLRLLELMGLKPSVRSTRELITNASKYGLIVGNHGSEELRLSPKGRVVVDPATSETSRREAGFDLSIEAFSPFKNLYNTYVGKPMPSLEVMQDTLTDLDEGDRRPCVDIFIGNVKGLGLLRTIGGAVHLVSMKDLVADHSSEANASRSDLPTAPGFTGLDNVGKAHENGVTDFGHVCFFIGPIGDKHSADIAAKEHRRHSDTILNQYIRRALEEQGLKVVRADEIAEAGMISKQIIEYILNSKLVIADLSYNNPNVFYELALRHVTGKPTVHVIRRGDKIPFDVGNFRTITIGLNDVHDAIAEIDTHRAEISNHVRQALQSGESRDNPILSFFPNVRFSEG